MGSTTSEQNASTWWRWIALPFAAVLGALAGSIALALLQWLGLKLQGGFSTDGWYYRYIMPLITSAVFGWLYVLITFHVAPKGKLIAATVMTTLFVVLCVVGTLSAWVLPSRSAGYAIQQTVGAVASIVAAISATVAYKDEYRT